MFSNQGYIVFIFQCIHSIINVLILHLITRLLSWKMKV
ncbi:hypothetical protein MEO_06202 [Candida albicans P94015]|nr:hypothetical protein MEO_06202 [Candida albicans P94015]